MVEIDVIILIQDSLCSCAFQDCGRRPVPTVATATWCGRHLV